MMRPIYFVLAFAWMCSALLGQEAEEKPQQLKLDRDAVPSIPEDAFLYATIHVKEIMDMPELKLVPWEILMANCADTTGVDPSSIERLDLVARFQEGLGPLVRFVVIAKTNKPMEFDKEKLMMMTQSSSISFVVLNERYAMMGDYDSIHSIVNKPAADGELRRQMARIGDSAVASAVLTMGPVQKYADKILADSPEEIRPQVDTLVRKTKMLAARVDLKDQSLPVVLETASDADAMEVEEALKAIFHSMETLSQSQFEASKAGLPPRIVEALDQYNARHNQELRRVSQLTRKGPRLTSKLTAEYWEISQMGANVSVMAAMMQALQTMRERQ